jgi:hypothetical protein
MAGDPGRTRRRMSAPGVRKGTRYGQTRRRPVGSTSLAWSARCLRKRLAATRKELARSATFIRRFEAHLNSLEAKDRLGNFEIQRLMSAYNQAATLASNVMKKQDETASAIIRHIA